MNLKPAIYPAVGLSVGFWAFAIQDFLCSSKGGDFCTGYLLSVFTVAKFGAVGACLFGMSALFFMLRALKDWNIGKALRVTGLIAFGQIFAFEWGIILTDGWQFKDHVLAMQEAPFMAWSGFFTNEFLFVVSGMFVVFYSMWFTTTGLI